MENMDAKENDRKHYRGIEKQTDNPFLNLYHIDALGRDGTERRFIIILRPEMMKTISNTRPTVCAPRAWRSTQ